MGEVGSRRERECQLSPPPPLHPRTPQMCSTPKELKGERKEGRERGLKGGMWERVTILKQREIGKAILLASLTCF